MKTYSTKLKEIQRQWWLIDAQDQILGRLATKIATLLIGKHKVNYVSHLDCGDYVVVTNIEKIEISGKKEEQKIYYRHSGYPSGLKAISYEHQMIKDPKKVLIHAIKGMLPKNRLQSGRINRLKLFIGDQHNYTDKQLKNIN